MAYWKFLDYVDFDGTNQIEAWIDSLQHGKKVRARLRALLEHLQDVRGLETDATVEPLTGDCSGLLVIKFRVRENRCRPMFYKGPDEGEATILVGARKAGQREYDPRRACQTALGRQAIVEADRERIIEHDYTPT